MYPTSKSFWINVIKTTRLFRIIILLFISYLHTVCSCIVDLLFSNLVFNYEIIYEDLSCICTYVYWCEIYKKYSSFREFTIYLHTVPIPTVANAPWSGPIHKRTKCLQTIFVLTENCQKSLILCCVQKVDYLYPAFCFFF